MTSEHADQSPEAGAELNIGANRKQVKYGRGEMLGRVLWGGAQVVFRLSPRPCFGFRRFLLKLFGAKIGKNVNIYPSARIFLPWNLEIGDWSSIGESAEIYNLGKVTIGSKATISQRAHLCAGTHDYRDPAFPLQRLPITIGDEAWICADAFVGPGVTIGNGAIVGARAVAMRNVGAWKIATGNPAAEVKDRPRPGK
jgi:putative colanic acid biosynthesis acetyltransferase WcaF